MTFNAFSRGGGFSVAVGTSRARVAFCGLRGGHKIASLARLWGVRTDWTVVARPARRVCFSVCLLTSARRLSAGCFVRAVKPSIAFSRFRGERGSITVLAVQAGYALRLRFEACCCRPGTGRAPNSNMRAFLAIMAGRAEAACGGAI